MSPRNEERRPREGAIHDLGDGVTGSTPRGTDSHATLMNGMAWSIRWLDRHEGWWARSERWRREGRVT